MSGQKYFVNKSTASYARVTAGSFKIFDRIIEEECLPTGDIKLRFDWLCVCGRQEATMHYLQVLRYQNLVDGHLIDVAKIIELVGSISVKHLQQDGFSEQEIKEIRKGYKDDPYSRAS